MIEKHGLTKRCSSINTLHYCPDRSKYTLPHASAAPQSTKLNRSPKHGQVETNEVELVLWESGRQWVYTELELWLVLQCQENLLLDRHIYLPTHLADYTWAPTSMLLSKCVLINSGKRREKECNRWVRWLQVKWSRRRDVTQFFKARSKSIFKRNAASGASLLI